MELLLELYNTTFGRQLKDVERLTAQGSNRCYLRFTDEMGQSVIGCIGTSVDENGAFIHLSRHFVAKGLPVPRVLAVSDDKLRYLQDDLGTRSLFDTISEGRRRCAEGDASGYDEQERELLRRTVTALPRVQLLGGEGLDYSVCYPQPAMDETCVMFDLNYFKYCFLKATGIDFHELRLEYDFRALAGDIARLDGTPMESAFLYRDFQARNIMLDAAGNPHFIDFQGGRQGAVYYDVASFLWQASARYPQKLRDELINSYIDSVEAIGREHGGGLQVLASIDRKSFRQRLSLFVLFRVLQVLGAYGFRGYFERKQHFIDSIPPALANLRQLIQSKVAVPYPYLQEVLEKVVEAAEEAKAHKPNKLHKAYMPHEPSPPSLPSPLLTIRIFSFSYKRGIPADENGNGGGYVFDCRSTHNPGRYEPYKQLTGLDEPVIRFLEADGEILRFLQHVYQLADAHVERYLQRGFTSLMFCFGCTGGQHRSVYSAQHLAEHLHSKYGVKVELTHREQGIHTVLPAQ